MGRNPIKAFILLTICFFLLQSASICAYAEAPDRPKAANGEMDLTDWNWEQDGIVDLNGEWEFYWKRLLTPEDFKDGGTGLKKELITLPRAWNKYTIDGEELIGSGYATYRLTIYHSKDEILGIKIPRIFTAYKLWANGELIASAGKLGTDYKEMTPQYLPQVKYINPQTNTTELIIQVSNFRHRSGGILESIKVGSADQITEMRTRNLTLELFLFGSLFIIGFYHIALYIFRSKDRSTLYFGTYSLLISARTLLVGEIYFIHLFPGFIWEAAHKIQTLSYYIGVPLVVMFLQSTFPQDVSNKAVKLINIVVSGFALLVLLTPARIFTYVNPFYQIFSFAVILYVVFVVIVACIRRREGAYLIGIGMIILVLTALNDIIFFSVILADSDNHFLRSFITRGNLSSWGLLIFIFTQSLVLAKKLSKSFSEVEVLTEQLQKINSSLEQKVAERTLALETSKEELKKAYQAVSRSEKSLRDFMQNISHDLRTPLSAVNGFANAIMDGIVTDSQQQKQYLKRIVDKVNNLSHMVQELQDLSQLETRQLEFEFLRTPVKSLIESVSEKYSFDMLNQNVPFKVNCLSDFEGSVMIDHQRLERVFGNLLNNALKYSPKGSPIEVNFSLTDDRKQLLVEVSDRGIGISEEDLPYIFQRFYMISKVRQGGANSKGLGLAIVKEIVEYHNGRIWVESEPGLGSCFFFTLPLYDEISVENA